MTQADQWRITSLCDNDLHKRCKTLGAEVAQLIYSKQRKRVRFAKHHEPCICKCHGKKEKE